MEAGNAALKLPDNLSEAEQKKAGVQLKVISGGQGGGGAAKEIKPGQTIEIENETTLPASAAKTKPKHLSAVPDQPTEEPESESADQPANKSGENKKPAGGQSGNNTSPGSSGESSNNQTANNSDENQSSDQPAGETGGQQSAGQEASSDPTKFNKWKDSESVENPDGSRGVRKTGKEVSPEEKAAFDKNLEGHDAKMDEFAKDPAAAAKNDFDQATQERENKKQQEAEEDQAGEKKPGDKEKSAGEGKKNPNEITNEDEAKDAQAQLTKNQRNAAGEKNKKDEDANKKAEAEDEQKSPDTTKIFWAGWLQGAWIDYISWLGLDFISLFFIIMPNWVLYYWGGILRLLSIQPGSEWFAGGAGGEITGLKKIKANFFMRLWLGLSKYLPWLASLWTGFVWFILLPCLVYLLFSCEGQKAIANSFDGTVWVLAVTYQVVLSWVGLCF